MKKVCLFIAISLVIPILAATPGNNIQLQQIQAFAQANNNNNGNNTNSNSFHTIDTKDIVNMTTPSQKVVLRGMISSDKFNRVGLKPGENPHGIVILPNRPDGTIYTGIVTFTATKPVEIGVSHRLPIDNSTFSRIDTKTFGNLYLGYHHDKGEAGTPGVLSTASVIVPNYGTEAPYFSASLPFVGDSLWLKTSHGEPFIAVYSLSADIIQPLVVLNLDSSTNTTKGNIITSTTSP
jgi:hypothetical protein